MDLMMSWTYSLVGKNRKEIQNFGGDSSWTDPGLAQCRVK